MANNVKLIVSLLVMGFTFGVWTQVDRIADAVHNEKYNTLAKESAVTKRMLEMHLGAYIKFHENYVVHEALSQ